VENFFFYEGYNPEHNVDRFLPDGNTEIIIDLTDNPKYIYDNETLKEIQSCHNVWVSGVRTESITIPSGKESRMLVITFKKGKAWPFYPLPVNELTDYVVDADLIFGNKIIDLREQLLSSGNIEEMFSSVEDFLLKTADFSLALSVPSKCIDYAVTSLVQNPVLLQLKTLSNRLGYSQKHFIDLFKKQVGVNPKTYLKIIRFQKAIQEIELKKSTSWSQIAIESGFYDQAHFINEFKSFSGFTPNEYLRLKTDQLNYIPVG
jgi:AraC-like DNA-binding protein